MTWADCSIEEAAGNKAALTPKDARVDPSSCFPR
jgi:hypothetical protein